MTTTELSKEGRYESARQFFLNLIVKEAANEGQPLSGPESAYLLAIGSGDDGWLSSLEKAVDQSGGSDDLVLRASELIKRAMDRDIANDPATQKIYEDRFNDLGNEDFLLWSIVFAGVRRQRANRVGRVLQIGFAVAAIAVLFVLINLVLGLFRH